MNIWKVIANEGYNNAFLIDKNRNQCFDPDSDFTDIKELPPTRLLKIEITEKGFPDIMNYWGMNGTIIVNSRVKELIQDHYGCLAIQFLPCECDQFKNNEIELWLLNVCEYHDVLDLNKSICKKIIICRAKRLLDQLRNMLLKKTLSTLIFLKSIWKVVNIQLVYLYLIDLRK